MSVFLNSVTPLALIALGIWLMSDRLPVRSHFVARSALVLLSWGSVIVAAYAFEFTMFPPLTDLTSYIRGIASFLIVFGGSLILQRVIYDCPLITSLFVCSMAYALQTAGSTLARIVSNYVFSEQSITAISYARHLLILAAFYLVAYRLFIRKLNPQTLLRVNNLVALLAGSLAVIVNMVLDLLVKDVSIMQGLPSHYAIALNVAYAFVCVFVIYAIYEIAYSGQLRTDLALAEQLRETSARQLELSRTNIQAINRRVHDIRKSIARMDTWSDEDGRLKLREVLREIEVFDLANSRTGNSVTDAVLLERGLVCNCWGITLSCMIDGHALDPIDDQELYSFLCALLDKAIELTRTVESNDGRRITFRVMRQAGSVVVSLEGTCASPPSVAPFQEDEFERFAQTHSGLLDTGFDDGVYHLSLVLLPA